MYLNIGDVALVRSAALPEHGDHYIVVTGPPVMKERGLRPQEIAMRAPRDASKILDLYDETNHGLVALKFGKYQQEWFLKYHGIEIKNGKVVFP